MNTTERLFRVEWGTITAGFIVRDGYIVVAAPVLKRLLGSTVFIALDYFERRGAAVEELRYTHELHRTLPVLQ